MQAANLRNNAEGALVIAAFGNLQVRREEISGLDSRDRRGRQQMRRAGVRNRPRFGRYGASQQLGQVEEVAGADENVHLGHRRGELGRVALRQTPRDHQPLAEAALLDLRRFEDGVDRFLLRRLDKRACVHQQHLRLFGLERDLESRRRQRAKHQLAVGKILGASKREQVNFFHSQNRETYGAFKTTRRILARQSGPPAVSLVYQIVGEAGAVTMSAPGGALNAKIELGSSTLS